MRDNLKNQNQNHKKDKKMNVKISQIDQGICYKIERPGANDKTLHVREIYVDDDEINDYADFLPPEEIKNLPVDQAGDRKIYAVMFREAPGPNYIPDRICTSWQSAIISAKEMIDQLN